MTDTPETTVDNNSNRTMRQKYLRTKIVFLIGYTALLALFVFWNLSRPSGFNITIFLIQCVPLLAFLPGVLQNHYRTYSWVCFIILFYFIKAVEGAFASTANFTDGIFIGLTVYIFVCAMMASRWAQRMLYQD